MIGALQRLKAGHEDAGLPDQLAAFGIKGRFAQGLSRLFMSHPPIDDRIAALAAGSGGSAPPAVARRPR